MLRIKQILKEQGKSQIDLANELKMSTIGVNKLINGNPTLETLQKIAKALNVEVIDLFEAKPGNEARELYIKENDKYKPIGWIKDL
ncbi:helix-turn-helix domain-containing protein [Pseudotamlana agarivorans]|uniref:helix-turn-helix domain-containing protein n=1 Tax=Pseudotamlana agarivorans TaxID=481183 RepID=UPI000832BE37|nr:helix-turn-helix transcriptional regulator [Tamlana agarivorans]